MKTIPLLAVVDPVEDALALYDCVQFWRAPDDGGSPGTFVEITSATETPARAEGSVSGPWATLPGKVLNVVLSNGDTKSVTFATGETALLAALARLNTLLDGFAEELAADSGKVALISPIDGTGSTMLLTGTAVAVLGLPTATIYGKSARPLLTRPTIHYKLKDFAGDTTFWYKWRLYSSLTGAAGDFSTPKKYDPDLTYGDAQYVTGTLVWAGPGRRPAANKRVRYALLAPFNFEESSDLRNALPNAEAEEALTNEQGKAEIQFYKGQKYKVWLEGTGVCRTILVPDANFNILDPDVSVGADAFTIVTPEPPP